MIIAADAESALASFEPGHLVDGKYRVERLLGVGGMGAVWAGSNEHTGKRVALKVLLRALASTPEARELFTTEGLVASKVNHPNVVSVFDVVEHNGMTCIVMELLDGEPLSSLLERNGRLNAQEAAWLLLPAMRGVAAAHAQGVIHRDLKPQNIFLCTEPDGRIVTAKVLDFGISVLMDSVFDRARGLFVGTPNYMSPEHLAGTSCIDGRADVYGFGILLYEALTGQMAFPGQVGEELFDRVINQAPPSLADLRPDISQGMVQIIEKAMAKQVELRFASLNEMVTAMEVELQALGMRAQAFNPMPVSSDAAAKLRATPSGGVPAVHQETVVMYVRAGKDVGEAPSLGSFVAGGTNPMVRPNPGRLVRVTTMIRRRKVALASAMGFALGLSVWWIARPSIPEPPMREDKALQRAPVIEPSVPRPPVWEPTSAAVSAPKPLETRILEPPIVSSPRKDPPRTRAAKEASGAPATRVLPRGEAASPSVKRSKPVTTGLHRAGELTVDDF